MEERLEDNFDSKGALAALSALITDLNNYRSAVGRGGRPPRGLLLREVAGYVTRILAVFGEGGW